VKGTSLEVLRSQPGRIALNWLLRKISLRSALLNSSHGFPAIAPFSSFPPHLLKCWRGPTNFPSQALLRWRRSPSGTMTRHCMTNGSEHKCDGVGTGLCRPLVLRGQSKNSLKRPEMSRSCYAAPKKGWKGRGIRQTCWTDRDDPVTATT